MFLQNEKNPSFEQKTKGSCACEMIYTKARNENTLKLLILTNQQEFLWADDKPFEI